MVTWATLAVMAVTAGLTVAAVARRLGVAPATLRTWDRRYGLGPQQHDAGAHRRYRPADVARLEVMRRLVAEGVAPADAAAAARSSAPEEGTDPPYPSLPLEPDDLVRGVTRAALALDGAALVATVGDLLAEHGVTATWERVLVPALVGAGARWEATGEGVEVEHLLSDAVATALHRHAGTHPPEGRRVLLACAPGDLHSLPLRALAGALEERGHGSRLLGAAVPVDALHAAVRRTGPTALVVWSQTPATADLAALAVPPSRPATRVVVGGPGWPAELPPGVARATSLGAATDLVERLLAGKPIPSRG